MAAAYRYADGGPASSEILMMKYISRFGAEAVLGRRLFAREIRRMVTAENIVFAFQSFHETQNAAAWARENPKLAELLNKARILAEENG